MAASRTKQLQISNILMGVFPSHRRVFNVIFKFFIWKWAPSVFCVYHLSIVTISRYDRHSMSSLKFLFSGLIILKSICGIPPNVKGSSILLTLPHIYWNPLRKFFDLVNSSMHRIRSWSLLGASPSCFKGAPIGSQTAPVEGVAVLLPSRLDSWMFSVSSSERYLVWFATVMVCWNVFSVILDNRLSTSGSFGSLMFSIRANSIVNRRWASITKLLDGYMFSNGGWLNFLFSVGSSSPLNLLFIMSF